MIPTRHKPKKTPRKKKDKAAKDGLKRMCFFFSSGKSSRDVFGWSVSSENLKGSYEMIEASTALSKYMLRFGLLGMFWGPVIPTKIRCPRKPSGYVGWLLRYSNIYSIPQYLGKFSQKWLFCKNPRLHLPYGRV